MEELSICGRWFEDGKRVKHFLGVVHVKEVTAEALTRYLLQFLRDKDIAIHGCSQGGSRDSDKPPFLCSYLYA